MRATICVCVCTYKRPQMLARCLSSLLSLEKPEGADIEIIVVDNEAEPNNLSIVDQFGRHPIFHYIHCPRRGISQARNAALEAALSLDADWIAFIDDDETAANDWIRQLFSEAIQSGSDVVSGIVLPIYPEPRPFWAVPPDRASKFRASPDITQCSTANVIFSSRLVRSDGMGLRFNEAAGLSGGEDIEFFARARLKGARIIRSQKPIVFEELVPSRLTYRKQVTRAYWTEASNMRVKLIERSAGGLFLRRLPKIANNAIRGTFLLLIAALVAPFSRETFKRKALKGGRRICKAAGAVAGIMARYPQPYKTVDGY